MTWFAVQPPIMTVRCNSLALATGNPQTTGDQRLLGPGVRGTVFRRTKRWARGQSFEFCIQRL